MNNPKKIVVSVVLGAMLITGAVSASNQSATVTISGSAVNAESSHINGTTGTGKLTAYLNNPNAAKAKIEAKKVVAFYPDTQIAQFTVGSTAQTSQTLNNMTPNTALFYAELQRNNILYATDATGVIQNFN